MLPCDYYFTFNNDLSNDLRRSIMKDFISYNMSNIQIGRSEDLLGDDYWFVVCPDKDEDITAVNFFKDFYQMISFLKCYYFES